ncbi:MAG: ribosome biogenesis GTPase YlqF [Clostridia bacterium]|nr:ribosome biogenesis GTPase YlqF [Clostridia bacterium]
MNINWYPGHMAKTKKLLVENLKLVDVVIELMDARIPISSRNPDFDSLFNSKKRIWCLNKSDLADPIISDEWRKYYNIQGIDCVFLNSRSGQGIKELISNIETMMEEKFSRDAARGLRRRPIRAMVTGIPNVGKSTFINSLTGRSATRTGDRPGVTKDKQWIKVNKVIHLLDTPGILWPRLGDEKTGLNLAFTGAIKDEIMDLETIVAKLLEYLSCNYRKNLEERYNLTISNQTGIMLLEEICKSRGLLLPAGQLDTLKGSQKILDEFRGAVIGRISLEKP